MLKRIKLPTFNDERGSLSVVEFKEYFKWEAKRAYFLCDVKLQRGGHCVKGEKKIYICQKGSVKAKLHDGKKWEEFNLSGYGDAILMEGNYYRDFYDFSDDCVLLAISSVNYNKDDYIYDFDEFVKYVKNK